MKVVLVDDEPIALNYLDHKLSAIDDIRIVGKFIDPVKCKETIKDLDVDVIFLDIQMPEINGIELAEQLLEENPSLNIVFITAYQEYAIKAFELNALDYLLKPISSNRLLKTIRRIRKQIGGQDPAKEIKEDLYLCLFNEVRLTDLDGKTITLKWRTSKAEQLFLYLVHNRATTIDKATLMDLLWEDLGYENAAQQLYTTIYQIRKTLENYKDHFIIKSNPNGYLLTLKNVNLDIDIFEEAFKEQKEINGGNIQDLERAINVVKGGYLNTYDYPWCEMDRHRLALLWIQNSLEMLKWYYYENNNMEKVINHAFKISQRYPYEEEAYYYLMRALAKVGNHKGVIECYTGLTNALREIDEKPKEETISWYTKWQNRTKV